MAETTGDERGFVFMMHDMYDEAWLIEAIKRGETDIQDFKQTITSSEKIAKTLVAFSNWKGGRLIIGVKDNGVISGTSVTEDAFMIQAAFERYSKNVLPLKNFVVNVQKKKVLVVEVEKNNNEVALSFNVEKNKWLAYTRYHDQTVVVGFVGFLSLLEQVKEHSVSTFGDKEKKITGYLEKFAETKPTLNELKKNLQLNRKEAITSLLNLLNLKLIKLNYDRDEERFELA